MHKKDKPVSPGQLIWQGLKQNIPAMFGLAVVTLSFLVAIFCFLIVPDKTPDANRMCLPISMRSPGFEVTMLKIRNNRATQENRRMKWINGAPDDFRYLPVDSFIVLKDAVKYLEFDGIAGEEALWQSIEIDKLGLSESLNGEELLSRDFIEHRKFILGTDRFGRDLFSRLILASRISLTVGFIAVFISLFVGITLGVIAGFYGGWIDDLIVWLINVVWSIPTLLLVIAITMALGKGMAQVFIAVGLTMWVEIARMVRGQVITFREMEFVLAGRALGLSNFRLIFRHMLPNIIGPVIVIAAANFATAILLEAGLSFLGMGAQPPTPSWGMMIKENYGYIVVDAAYLAILPGIAIMLMVLSFTLLGNGLRDAFDVNRPS